MTITLKIIFGHTINLTIALTTFWKNNWLDNCLQDNFWSHIWLDNCIDNFFGKIMDFTIALTWEFFSRPCLLRGGLVHLNVPHLYYKHVASPRSDEKDAVGGRRWGQYMLMMRTLSRFSAAFFFLSLFSLRSLSPALLPPSSIEACSFRSLGAGGELPLLPPSSIPQRPNLLLIPSLVILLL